MSWSESADVLSRILLLLLGLIIWALYYLNARCTYRLPMGGSKTAMQLSLLLGSVAIFVLQASLMSRLVPGDAYGSDLKSLVLIEAGGAFVVGFGTLLWERAKHLKALAVEQSDSDRRM